MCLILFAYGLRRHRPLVVAANRDEYHARPARAAHWWDRDAHSANAIFGGRDEEAGGTWLAVSGDGRLAAVTNWTEDRNAAKAPGSRGELPWRFLAGRQSAMEFAAGIEPERYAGFNFIAYDGRELVYASNRTGERRALASGVYGLTNTRLGPAHGRTSMASPAQRPPVYEQWPKAVFGAAALNNIAATATCADLVDLLSKPHLPIETPPDREQAPERSYSPCFIHGAEYGTRASTAIIVEDESIEFVEQQHGPFGKPGQYTSRSIRLGPTRPSNQHQPQPEGETTWTST